MSRGVCATRVPIQLMTGVGPAQGTEFLSGAGLHFISSHNAFDHLYGIFGNGVLLMRMRSACRELDPFFFAEGGEGFAHVLVVCVNRSEPESVGHVANM